MSPRTRRRLLLAVAIVLCSLFAAWALSLLVVVLGVTES